jgi:hypothetical protein
MNTHLTPFFIGGQVRIMVRDMVRIRQDRARPGKARQGQARPGKAKARQSKQEKTSQVKSRQGKTSNTR